MIPLLGRKLLGGTRLRYGAPTIINGRTARPLPTSQTFTLTAQPLPDRLAQVLPDGVDAQNVLYAVSYFTDLRTGSGAVGDVGTYADRVIVDGLTYELTGVKLSSAFLTQPAHVLLTGINVQTLVAASP